MASIAEERSIASPVTTTDSSSAPFPIPFPSDQVLSEIFERPKKALERDMLISPNNPLLEAKLENQKHFRCIQKLCHVPTHHMAGQKRSDFHGIVGYDFKIYMKNNS
jgi:hypothetical protein